MSISGITPQPREEVATPYGVRLIVPTEPGTEVTLQISYRASEMGHVDAGVRFRGEHRPVRSVRLSLTRGAPVDAVLRGLAIYLVLMLLFRLAGKRTLSQVTTFDFVLLLVIGKATQQALLGEDLSVTHAAIVIATLIGLDRASDNLWWRFGPFKRVTESVPLILVDNGRLLQDVMAKEHVSEDDIMHSARAIHGWENLDQVKYAIMETSGGISIVPRGGAS